MNSKARQLKSPFFAIWFYATDKLLFLTRFTDIVPETNAIQFNKANVLALNIFVLSFI